MTLRVPTPLITYQDLNTDLDELAINVKASPYNAVGDGITDDTTAVQNAANALHSTKGGILFFPTGTYLMGRISFTTKHNITLRGQGRGGLSGGFGSTLLFSGTGSTPFIDATQSYGFKIEDLEVIYTSSSFTGDLVNLDNSSGSGANDTNQVSMNRVFLGSQPTNTMTARSLISLNNVHTMCFRDVVFAGADVAVFGKTTNTNYANTIRFEGCLFLNYQDVAHVKNADGAWSFAGCSFQQLNGGTPGALVQGSGIEARGVTFDGCWFGDVGSGSGQQILWEGHGLNIRGCRLGVETAGAKVVTINANNTRGIVIQGNVCKGPGGPLIEFGATTGHIGLLLGPNYEADISAPTGGTVPLSLVHLDANGKVTFGGTAALYANGTNELKCDDQFTLEATSATNTILVGRVVGDSVSRWAMNAQGAQEWGNSAGARDTFMARSGAGLLRLSADSAGTSGAGWQFVERADPSAPATNNAILYAKDNGAGKTQLVVRFPTGAVQVIATEP